MKKIASFTLAFALLLSGIPALAQDLKIGDQAPMLEATHWVKGTPVDMAKGKGKQIYVLEFWASWCVPCRVTMPHLSELQQQYKDKNVTVIGVTTEDPGNKLDAVKQFVEDMGEKMDFAVAFDETAKMDEVFMRAAGQDGIPTTFVVDRSGRLAWVGHPMDGLDKVLEEMVAGTYDIEVASKMSAIQRRLEAASAVGDRILELKALDDLIALKPEDPQAYLRKFDLYEYAIGNPAKAFETAKRVVEVVNDDAVLLASFGALLARSDDELGFNKLCLEAIDKALSIDSTEVEVHIARIHAMVALDRDDGVRSAAEEAVERLDGNADGLGRLAQAITELDMGVPFADLAVKAVDKAIEAEPEEPAHAFNKFMILALNKGDQDAARKVGGDVISKAGDNAEMLDGFAWQLLTLEPLQGKFNKLALASAEKCHELTKGENWVFLDTIALARYENGEKKSAIDLQKKAVKLCDQPGAVLAELQGRLQRYEEGK